MITCVLKGGLGNMMFQVAFLEYAAYKNNLKSYYYNLDAHRNFLYSLKDRNEYKQLSNVDNYLTIFKNFTYNSAGTFENLVEVPFEFTEILIKDNSCYNGFFQSEKYFNDKKFIWNLFEPSDVIQKILTKYDNFSNKTTCSIHVRRGDYLHFPNVHPTQTMQYYVNAISKIGKVDTYLIFSDDIEWCKNNFRFLKNIFYVTNEKDYVELFLQSRCTHNIISNSSFSWWGAWLNKNSNKKVIAPLKWFGQNCYNDKDIIPESWIKI